MDIRSGAYRLCKTIQDSQQRKEIRQLLLEFNKGKAGDEHLSNLAGRSGLQLLEYLVFEKLRGDDEAKKLFEQTHKQLQTLNEQCLFPITKQIPQCTKALDPYKAATNYELPENTPDGSIMSHDTINEMAQLFHHHPAMEIILSTTSLVKEINEEEYSKRIENLLEKIIQSPDELRDIADKRQMKPSEIEVMRHMIALICLRDALWNLDQIVFQAIILDKPPLLNENNVIKINSQLMNDVGNHASITYQPDESITLTMYAPLIILAKIKSRGRYMIDQLFRIEGVKASNSKDMGRRISLELLEIDGNMTSFSNLFRVF